MAYVFLETPECWIFVIFVFGYGTGFILHIFIQFDTEYVHRNFRDWHYTTWFMALPVTISMSPLFRPIHGPLRIFYGFYAFNWHVYINFSFVISDQTTSVSYSNILGRHRTRNYFE